MMTGYHGQPAKTREAEWFDPTGKRFIRTGDVGRFDADGFLTLFDRRKDMIISGGFNIYPSDLETQLRAHPAVDDVAVVGVPSEQWGETPVAYVVSRAGQPALPEDIMGWYNQRAGKTDRKSTRLNSSHLVISYAVFSLKKKKQGAGAPRGRRRSRSGLAVVSGAVA